MAKLIFNGLIGQSRVKETLASAFDCGQIAHAYLFSGNPGCGKFQGALEFGMALLCSDRSAAPCGKCDSCVKIRHHANPNFHMAMPVSLDSEERKDGKITDNGWGYLHESCLKRISDPYLINTEDSIGEIPVDWIREITHAILRGAVNASRNVAVITGIDTMNKSSANAMLKTLEEPPAGTVIILTTDRLHSVLPTIVSRCQTIRFSRLSEHDISSALSSRSGLPVNDAGIAAAVNGADGSLGNAIMLMEMPVAQLMEQARKFLNLAAKKDRLAIALELDALNEQFPGGSKNSGAVERMLSYVISFVRGALLKGIKSTEKYINTDSQTDMPGPISNEKAAALEKICRKAISAIRARGSVPIVLAAWTLSMMEIFNEQEQPSR